MFADHRILLHNWHTQKMFKKIHTNYTPLYVLGTLTETTS